jgi:hypothetical protein
MEESINGVVERLVHTWAENQMPFQEVLIALDVIKMQLELFLRISAKLHVGRELSSEWSG